MGFLQNPLTSGAPKTVSEVTELRIYPIKSCRGIKVDSTYLTRQGLDLDRRWMFAEVEGKESGQTIRNKFMTIRQKSQMTLIDTDLVQSDDGQELLRISISGTDKSVSIPARPTRDWLEENASLQPCHIWSSDTDGWVYKDEISNVFCDYLGKKVVLIYKGPTDRVAGGNAAQQYLGRQSTVNFPDVMPLQIANEASIRELNKRLREKGADELTIERFRPNIIVKGADEDSEGNTLPLPWSEDSWKTVRIMNRETSGLSSWITSNSLDIDVQARCARCQVPNVHPDTGIQDKHEPWDTLVSYRRVDEGINFKPCFGMLSVPRNEGEIAVGMRFEVTEVTDQHLYVKGF